MKIKFVNANQRIFFYSYTHNSATERGCFRDSWPNSMLQMTVYGLFFPQTWNIYIRADRPILEKYITLCHELTHLAIEVVSHICFVPIRIRERLHMWFDK